MIPEISITKAGLNDAALITELCISTFTESYAPYNTAENVAQYIADNLSLEQIKSELLNASNTFYLATYNDLTVGYTKLRTSYLPAALTANSPIEVERIYVVSKYQKHKIGAALMVHCMSHAINYGHDTLWLGVWEHNYKAIGFYQKWGFETFGSHIFRFGNEDQTDLWMRKLIESGKPTSLLR